MLVSILMGLNLISRLTFYQAFNVEVDIDAVYEMIVEKEAQNFTDEYLEWQSGQKESLLNQRKEVFERLEADFK